MAHWWHRGSLKATSPITFNTLSTATTDQGALRLCGDLCTSRKALLDLMSNLQLSRSAVEDAGRHYLSLLLGLVIDAKTGKFGTSPLRKLVAFKWTHTLLGNRDISASDSIYELVSMTTEWALWCMKHASAITNQESLTDDDAKEVFNCLSKASGLFSFAKQLCTEHLDMTLFPQCVDNDVRILEGYLCQSLAEAMEVTVSRAVELKHSSSVVAQVAFTTSELFSKAETSLASVEADKVARWRKYLEFKKTFYKAQALLYFGIKFLAEDQCGNSVRTLQEAKTVIEAAAKRSLDYSTMKGTGATGRPHEMKFFMNISMMINKNLDTANHENGFIYHQKVPVELPELDKSTSYGQMTPPTFELPSLNPAWAAEMLEAFDFSKIKVIDPDPVAFIKEPDSTAQQPTFSCVLS